jgi:hypothetical protein
MNRIAPLLCALVLVLAACAGSREEIVDEFLPPLDSTTTTSVANGDPSSTTTTLLVDVSDIEDLIAGLAEQVSEIRGLPLTVPPVQFVAGDELEARYQALNGLESIGSERVDAAYLRALGVLSEGDSVSDILSFCSLPGFFDPESNTLILDEGLEDLTPYGRRHLVDELLGAATNEAHGWWNTMAALRGSGETEAAIGLRALVQGDAAFHAAQYVAESLDSTDQFAIRLEEIACQQEGKSPPEYVTALIEYGPTAGRAFVETLIATGGVPALDAAYAKPPVSSEQIYHPPLYGSGEGAIGVELSEISVSGFTEVAQGTFGERMLRAVLSEGVSPAQSLQAATGWGGDTYRVLWDGSDVVLVILFEGDEARDARELAETLGGWASASLEVGGGRPDNQGLAFEGVGYAFVAHDDTTMLLVVSGDAVAGRSVRDTFWPRW